MTDGKDDENSDIEQTCPFCNAKWGACAHYDLMLDLEAEADELASPLANPSVDSS